MLRTFGLAGTLALAYAAATLSRSDARPSPTRPESSTVAASRAPDCGPEIANLDALGGAPMILLGELHGLKAAPAFAIDLACRLAATGKPVLLALEIPRQEQGRIDVFLRSNGGPSNEAALLDGPFWRRDFQDGRSSQARVALLDAARVLRASRVPIRVIAVDDAEIPGPARDSVMASELLATRKPGETVVFLVGDLHARTKPGAPWNRNIIWSGVRLRAQEPKLVSLDNRYLGGEAWLCLGNSPSDCGIRTVKGRGESSGFHIERFAQTDSVGFDGMFDLGLGTASPPAREDMRIRR
jgi:hypothetical protein